MTGAADSRRRDQNSWRRRELKQFLRHRRARLTPRDVGFASGGRRRTPGLRREEVAVLAGVGTSWYIQLEQGRDITVSPQVVNAIADALRLSEVERSHLHLLAGVATGVDHTIVSVDSDRLEHVVDGWMPSPAHVIDSCWNILAVNTAARGVFGFDPEGSNCLDEFFTETGYRQEMLNWGVLAPEIVSAFRRDAAQYAADRRFEPLVNRLLATSSDFRQLWDEHAILSGAPSEKVLDNPVVGRLEFEHSVLHLPDRPDIRLVLHTPVLGTETASRVLRLIEALAGVPAGLTDGLLSIGSPMSGSQGLSDQSLAVAPSPGKIAQ